MTTKGADNGTANKPRVSRKATSSRPVKETRKDGKRPVVQPALARSRSTGSRADNPVRRAGNNDGSNAKVVTERRQPAKRAGAKVSAGSKGTVKKADPKKAISMTRLRDTSIESPVVPDTYVPLSGEDQPTRWMHTPFVAKLMGASVLLLVIVIVTMLQGPTVPSWWPVVIGVISIAFGWILCHD